VKPNEFSIEKSFIHRNNKTKKTIEVIKIKIKENKEKE
jgi:hypothetical protein